MEYRVYTSKKFDREFEKLSNEEQKRIEKIFVQLKENINYYRNVLKELLDN